MFENFSMNIELVDKNAKMPTRAHDTDAGLDLYTPTKFIVKAGEDILIPLGIKMEFTDGYAFIIKEKSGIATKKKLDIGASVVDSSYRGIVHCHLFNNGYLDMHFDVGDKVAQGIVVPVWCGYPKQVQMIDNDTKRGKGGFGSSGK